MKKTLILPETMQKAEEQLSNVLPLHPKLDIVTGGRPPDGSDYLSSFPVGTVFLVKPNVANYDKPFLACWEVYQQSEKSTFIGTGMGSKEEQAAWVMPKEFCKVMLLHEVLYRPEKKEE